MAVSTQTMTDEQRKSVAIEYLKAFDRGGVTSDGGSILDLFADDAQVYFPKWGLANGKDEIGALFGASASFSKTRLARAHERLRGLLQVAGDGTACLPVSSTP